MRVDNFPGHHPPSLLKSDQFFLSKICEETFENVRIESVKCKFKLFLDCHPPPPTFQSESPPIPSFPLPLPLSPFTLASALYIVKWDRPCTEAHKSSGIIPVIFIPLLLRVEYRYRLVYPTLSSFRELAKRGQCVFKRRYFSTSSCNLGEIRYPVYPQQPYINY